MNMIYGIDGFYRIFAMDYFVFSSWILSWIINLEIKTTSFPGKSLSTTHKARFFLIYSNIILLSTRLYKQILLSISVKLPRYCKVDKFVVGNAIKKKSPWEMPD
jgi:hypothetical protein